MVWGERILEGAIDTARRRSLRPGRSDAMTRAPSGRSRLPKGLVGRTDDPGTRIPARPLHRGDRGGLRDDPTGRPRARAGLTPTGVRCHYLATGETTDGLFGLYRWEFGPGVSGPDAHFHRTMVETFYILTGEVRIFDGRDWVTTRPGDYALVPPGGLHGFKNVEGTGATMLLRLRTRRATGGVLRGPGPPPGRRDDDRLGARRVHAVPRQPLDGLSRSEVPRPQLEA